VLSEFNLDDEKMTAPSLFLRSPSQLCFSVMRICLRTQNWLPCMQFHAADETQFRVSVFYGLRDSIDNRKYNSVGAPRAL
jgi:hypothetical protein